MYIYIYIYLYIYTILYINIHAIKYSNAFHSTALTSIVPCLRESWSSKAQDLKEQREIVPHFGVFFFQFSEIPKITFKKIWEEKRHPKHLGVFWFPFSREHPTVKNFRGRCTCGPQGWQPPRNDQRWSGVCSSDGRSHCCCSLAKKNCSTPMLLGGYFCWLIEFFFWK